MSLLFTIDTREKLILRPACYKLCPELSALNEQEMMVIVLAFDYWSPLRRYNEADRIRRALLMVYDDNNPKLLKALEDRPPHDRITNAVDAYKSLQYDPKISLADKYQQTINDLQESINADLGDRDLQSKLLNIDRLRKNIMALEKEITEDVIAQGRLQGDSELSYLEQMQLNKKLYESVTKKKK